MPVRLEATIKRFIGSSTDEKPTAEVTPGSSFLETNTGVIYRFDGRVWVAATTEREEDAIYFQTMITLLSDIREALYNL